MISSRIAASSPFAIEIGPYGLSIELFPLSVTLVFVMPKINPEVLRWARESSSQSIEEAAGRIGISANRLEQFERGEADPSRNQLEEISRVYRRSMVTFYLSSPPSLAPRGHDYRQTTDAITNDYEPDVDALIRNVKVRQAYLRDALEDEVEESLRFVGSVSISDGVDNAAGTIEEILSFNLHTFRSHSSPGNAFKYLRTLIEDIGVFVLLIGDLGSWHTKFDVRVYRGFSIADPIAPLIVINDNDSPVAWSFTLLHEFCHLVLGNTGISGPIYSRNPVEEFCNAVSSTILLPESDLLQFSIDKGWGNNQILLFIDSQSSDWNISRPMIALRLYRAGAISRRQWVEISDQYREEWEAQVRARRESAKTGNSSGPNRNTLLKRNLGSRTISMVRGLMFQGSLSISQASTILGVPPARVHQFVG